MEAKDLRNYMKLNVYLNRSCDVLRNKFKHEWKLKYNEEWNDTSTQKLNNFIPQNFFKKLGKIQRNYINNGNIDEWDISLLRQLLFNKQLFLLTTNDENKIKELVDIRNKTAHYGSRNMPDSEFETNRKQLCSVLIALGDNEDELKKLECDDSIGGIQFSSEDVINDENTIEAKTLKDLGNKEFLCENYDKAIKHYTRAILLAGLSSTDRAMLYSNRYVCYFKLNDIENANKDSNDIVKLWPQWWRGYYRKAQIYNAINDYQSLTKAEKCLMQSQALEDKEEITALLNEVRQKIGPIDRHEFLDYRKHITSTEEIVDNYNKKTCFNVNVNAIKEFEKLSANSDDPVFKSKEDCRRGHRYRKGTDGFPLDYQIAAQCYSKAANRGSAEGLYNLYQMYSEGKGVKQDFDIALQYLLIATQQPPYIDVGHTKVKNVGVMEAEHCLGLCYDSGKFVKKDLRKALEWYEKAVDHESSNSANNLGLFYLNGKEFIDKDVKVGHMKMPNIGVMEAEHSLGLCYETGFCVKKDLIKAIEWYQKAVDHGFGGSANNLGLIYMNGVEFINRDIDKAEQLFKFAATKGDPNAMINIALLYLEKDEPELALEWCKRIRNKGYEYPNLDNMESIAKNRLCELEKTFKDICEHENINDDENSHLTLKEKLSQSLSECFPFGVNLEQKLYEIEEKSFNTSKSPVYKSSNLDKYDLSTLEKYANSGKLYAKKLLTAKIHFLNAMKVLFSIKDINNPSSDECRNFIKHLSLSYQIETIIPFRTETIERMVSFALNQKTTYDEDVRICFVPINFKDIDGNIIFLSQSLKVYPKNVFFLYIRGTMFGFRKQFEKSIHDFNEALKLEPNDYEILYLKAASMSKLENIEYSLTIDAYNRFLSIAPEDHRKVPECYYSMACLTFHKNRKSIYNNNFNEKSFDINNIKEAQEYYRMGLNAEEKQLSFFLPYDSGNKSLFELIIRIEESNNNTILPKVLECEPKNKQLINPYRIQIIRKHRENINEFFNMHPIPNTIATQISFKPPKIQKCAQSLAGLKAICLRDMDPTTDKIYDKCVIDLKVIDVVGTTGSSLTLVVEDNRKDVERCYIYNSPLLNDINEANNLYGIGCQISVINPYLRVAADMKPAIRIEDINSIVMREFIKDVCRYCCEANATKVCSRCKTALYCSKECQVKDFKQNAHKFVC